MLLFAAGVAYAIDFHARRNLLAVRTQWVDALALATANPPTNAHYRDDPSLRAVMIDAGEAHDPSVTASDRLADVRPWGIPEGPFLHVGS